MSDYGSRGYGSGSEEQGWDSSGRSRGFGDAYDDYAPQQRGAGGDGGYGDYAAADPYPVRTPSPHDEPTTSGRARVPGSDGTRANAARGSARVGGRRPTGLSDEESEDMKKAKKKKKRRRRLIAMACVMVIFLGIGTVVGTVFFERVPLPKEIEASLERNSNVYYEGGKEEMGRIGTDEGNRTYVRVPKTAKEKAEKKDTDVPAEVKHALLAMEDRKFYDHPGVDFWGVMRALVNNVTGGETQGASTLTQQYVGTVSKIRGDDSYFRKAKEAVMAMKMDDKYTKDEIIEHYLNLVYMGRGSYGLGAAVKAWYGPKQKVKDLTASQAAVIFAQVKSPDSVYDPNNGKAAKAEAKERWEYALDGLVEKNWLDKKTQKKYLKAGLPKVTDTESMRANSGADKATGFVSHGQIFDEAKEHYGLDEQDIRTNGYKIETTINKKLQDIVEDVATKGKGAMKGQKPNLRAALVAIDPRNGEVVAYYGGKDGTQSDKADAVHAPGSSFKEVTISAAVRKGWGPESHWDGSSPREFKERPDGSLKNSGEGNGADEPNITLRKATEMSLNTPMYSIATKVGANTIVKLARDMGVEQMQVPDDESKNDEHKVFKLDDKKVTKMLENDDKPRAFADNEVSFGQFPVSVVDMASVNSTLAAEGVRNETHFIKKITDANGQAVEPTKAFQNKGALDKDVARDVTDILTGVHPKSMGGNNFATNNQQFAAKSGTWERECGEGCDENASITFGGYVPELAAAAWVGDKENENGTVANADDTAAYGAGISGEVWKQFMEKAVQVKGFDSKKTFTKGPGGSGSEESEVGGGGEEGGENGGENGGGDEPTCGKPGLPSCGGDEPTCGKPGLPSCGGETPDCNLEPEHPSCGGQSPECNQPIPPPQCDNLSDRVRPAYYGAKDYGSQSRYAIREDYRQL